MTRPFYTGTLNAETYDLGVGRGRPGTDDDVPFYVELTHDAGGRVLELASGTGRVAIALAEAGRDVTGLERAASMLRQAELKRADLPSDVRERLRFVEGDMAMFDLGEKFDAVLIPARSFAFLLTPESQRKCLSCVSDHLWPGGTFAFQVFDPDLKLLVAGEPHPRTDTAVDPRTGNTIRVAVTECGRDHVEQVLRETWRFSELDQTGAELRVEEEELVLRWTYRHEMRHLLELSGFEVHAEYSDFRRSAPTYGAEQVWVTRRAR